MTYLEIKEIYGRKYIYERTSYRAEGTVRHTNKYIGPLVKVYKTSKQRANQIIKTILRQLKDKRKNPRITYITYHIIEQYTEYLSEHVKNKINKLLSG